MNSPYTGGNAGTTTGKKVELKIDGKTVYTGTIEKE